MGLLDYQDDSRPDPTASPYGLPPSLLSQSYHTKLNPLQEMAFQGWLQKNNVPFDPSPKSDYDMRGFYQALLNKDPRATSSINPNDGRMHFPDTYKTPYHESFSSESKYAGPGAPSWNEKDQLVTPDGRVTFDERRNKLIELLMKKNHE